MDQQGGRTGREELREGEVAKTESNNGGREVTQGNRTGDIDPMDL